MVPSPGEVFSLTEDFLMGDPSCPSSEPTFQDPTADTNTFFDKKVLDTGEGIRHLIANASQ
jgi:hypothetical protein